MAAACAALFAIFAACESDNKDDDSSAGQKVDPSLVGYWENLSLDPDLSVLTKIHINKDGTGEVYYILPNDSEHHYFYAAEFSFDDDKCSIRMMRLIRRIHWTGRVTLVLLSQKTKCLYSQKRTRDGAIITSQTYLQATGSLTTASTRCISMWKNMISSHLNL